MDFRTEDQDGMCTTLEVQWTIVTQKPPQPRLACSGCGGVRAFQSTGRTRLNANGRKLDAWLIYKCVVCEKTWNRPVFERHAVRDIPPAVLEALQANDPAWIRAEAFNLEALRRKTREIDEFEDYAIEKKMVRRVEGWTRVAIDLLVPVPASIRLDRLLAAELGMSRSRLQTLREEGMLQLTGDRADAMRRRIRTGMRITIDVSRDMTREAILFVCVKG